MKKLLEIVKQKWLKDTITTTILIIALIIVFIGLNLWIQSLDIDSIDVTDTKLYSLSDTSKQEIKDIKQEVTMYFFGIDEDTPLIDLAKQYTKANSNIKVEAITVEKRPDLQAKYGLTTQDQAIVVQSKDRDKILGTSDLYTYDQITYEQIDVTEQKLTNAIMATTVEEKPNIYFLKGHDEGLLTHITILKAYLENEINNVEELDLLVTNEIPDNCTVLAILQPVTDFTDFETQLITQYIQNGGKILWLGEATFTNKELPNVQNILNQFGVTIQDTGTIFEQDTSKMLLGTPYLILPNINYSEITKSISQGGAITMLNATKIQYVEDAKIEELGVTITNLLTTSDKSFYRTDLNSQSLTKIESDELGEFTVGTLLKKQINENVQSEMIIFGNAVFATDYTIAIQQQNVPLIYLYNNKDLVLNSISYLTQREDTITIRKNLSTVTYTATQQQHIIIQAIIFIVPAVIIVIGIVVWMIRRRKK